MTAFAKTEMKGLLLLVFLTSSASAFTTKPTRSLARVAIYHAAVPPSYTLQTRRTSGQLQEKKEEWDYIVIGSGIGGLSVASLLVQCLPTGRNRVLVLEQHDRPGGCCHSFMRKGYSFGTGIHYVGEMGSQEEEEESIGGSQSLKSLLDALTPQDNPIEWSRLPDHYESILLRNGSEYVDNQECFRRYDMVANRQAQDLKDRFPEEATAIDKFFQLVDRANAAFQRGFVLKCIPRPIARFFLASGLHRLLGGGFTKYAQMTVREVTQSLTNNQDLQAVLEYNWGDYGTPPDRAPFMMHAQIAKHFESGTFYPQGGPGKIPEKIMETIQAAGGEIRVRSPVRQILVENGRAVGVGLFDKNGHPRESIRARYGVISDAGYTNTFKYLVPWKCQLPQQASAVADENNNVKKKGGNYFEQSLSGISLFVGLKGDNDEDWQLPHHQLSIFPYEDQCESNEVRAEGISSQDMGGILVTSPSGKDISWKTHYPGRSTLEIMTLVPWSWFEKYGHHEGFLESHSDPGGASPTRGKGYSAVKSQLAELIWRRAREGLLAMGASQELPERVQDLDFCEVGTPLTFAHYLWSEKGSWYGLDHDTERFDPRKFCLTLRPDCPNLPGLYLSGQDISTCGFAGALMGGYICARNILGAYSPFRLLDEVRKKRVLHNGDSDIPESAINV